MAEVSKPIILDETGQAIVAKLQSIANASTPDDMVKTVNGIGVTSGSHNVVLPNLFTPQIYVKAPTGSTVTVTKGNTTLTPTEDSGTWTVSIPEWGQWVVVVQKNNGVKTVTRTDVIDVEEVKRYVVNATFTYGVKWGGHENGVLSRTDDAVGAHFIPYYKGIIEAPSSSFDNYYPWNEMTATDYGDEDYPAATDLGTLVKIPKFWYKESQVGDIYSLQISAVAQDGFKVSPAHQARTSSESDRDWVYIAKYHCSNQNWKSVASDTPMVNITRAQARTNIHSLDDHAWLVDYMMWRTTRMLFIVEVANWDSQGQIGYGRGNNSAAQACNYGWVSQGDSEFSYHTGTPYSSKTTYGVSVKYRNIVGLWDNINVWHDGITFNGSNVYAQKNPAEYSDTYSDGTLVCTRPTNTTGYDIKKWKLSTVEGYEFVLWPESVGTTPGTKYVKDCHYYNSSGVVLNSVGNYNQNLNGGMFSLDGNGSASATSAGYGAHLQYLP